MAWQRKYIQMWKWRKSINHLENKSPYFCVITKHIHDPYAHVGASLVALLVKNPSAMQETPVQFLGSEVPLEKG